MKRYLDLIPICAKVHKRQNRMTILCITIAVFLVTAIFSMADMAVRMEKIRAIETHGNWHVMLKDLTEQDAELVALRPDVASFAWYDVLNFDLSDDYQIKDASCVIAGSEEALLRDVYASISEGRFPEKDNEILLTNRAKAILSVSIGDWVTLETPMGSFHYVISGFGGEVTISTDADVIGAFLNRDAFQYLAQIQGGMRPAPVYFVQFKNGVDIRRTITEIRQAFAFTDQNISENTALLGLTGFSRDSYMMGLYLVAAILFLLVLTAGVLMIAGSLNSKTAERIQFFGMLRCIGATRAQIIRLVKLEALYWCRLAVPLGVLLGIVGTWGLCALLRFGVGAEFAQMPLFGVSMIGMVSGIIVGVLTVLLSAVSPARRAAKVSPVAAVSGNMERHAEVHGVVQMRFFKIETALGIHHAVADKKNLLLMTGSFALSIILFLSFSVLITWTNQAMPPLRAWAPDLSIASLGASCEIHKELVTEIQNKPNVKRAFGRMYQNIPAAYEGKTGTINLISYEAQQFQWAKADLTAGEISKVMEGGNNVLTVFDKSNTLNVGDQIQLADATLTVAGVLQDSPFDTSDSPTVICSEQTFTKLTGKDAYAVVDIQVSRKTTDAEINAIHTLAEKNRFFDNRERDQEAKRTYYMFCLFAYGFLGIIAVITVIHIINSISMSVSARMRQYGAMRAVGMDGRQITKMIAMETVTYTVLGFLVGCGCGVPLHRFLFAKMITSYWGTPWSIPITAISGIFMLMVLTALAAFYAPAKRIREMDVTAAINDL